MFGQSELDRDQRGRCDQVMGSKVPRLNAKPQVMDSRNGVEGTMVHQKAVQTQA